MDIWQLVRQLIETGEPMAIARNPMIQFGTEARSYLGATLLPERLVENNAFTEDKVVYHTLIANDGTRYSEPQMKQSGIVGSFDVRLGEIDIASELTGNDFDALMRIAAAQPDVVQRRVLQWMNNALNLSQIEKAELQRWQAIVDAVVPIRGLDGREYTVQLSNPAGHRVTIAGGSVGNPAGWYETDGSYNPLADIFAGATFLRNKGLEVDRIIGDSDITAALATNSVVQQTLGTITISAGTMTTRSGLASLPQINAYLQSTFGLPPIEEYNLSYRTQAGSGFFKKRGSLVFIARTERMEEFETGDDNQDFEILQGTLGYYAIGKAVGQLDPGRVILVESRQMKPMGVYGQGFCTAFPVIQEPEAIYVINVSKPT